MFGGLGKSPLYVWPSLNLSNPSMHCVNNAIMLELYSIFESFFFPPSTIRIHLKPLPFTIVEWKVVTWLGHLQQVAFFSFVF